MSKRIFLLGFAWIFASQLTHAQQSDAVMKVSVGISKGYSPSEAQKNAEALSLLEEIMNSDEFKKAVLNHEYRGEKRFAQTDLSNQEILEKIQEAQESYKDELNNTLDINLTLFNPSYSQRKVIGYTYPKSNTVWVNREFFDRFTPAQIAGNIMHEWLHKIGFKHDFNRTSRRSKSVPYAIGYIVVKLGKALEKQNKK